MGHLKDYSIFVLIFIGLAVSATRADYHYASHDGSNEYPYTSWETAADSIQKAIDASSPHDTVYIGAGEWHEAVATGVYDSVAIIGMGMDSTFCYADSLNTPVFEVDHGCSVEGITFRNFNNAACVRVRSYAGVSVRQCRFLNSAYGVAGSGVPLYISDCVFDSCASAIGAFTWVGVLYISNNLILNSYDYWAIELNVYSAIVENNIIINLPGSSIKSIHSGTIEGNVIIRNNIVINGRKGIGVDETELYNNTVKNINRVSSTGYGISASYGENIFNNSISACQRGIWVWDDIIANYNHFWNNEEDFHNSGYVIDSIGNIYRDPMYVSEYDVHLQAFSPLIDAGDPEVFDVDGSRSDIGAYGGQYGSSYDYPDLPPSVPDSLSGNVLPDTIILTWGFNTEADFNRYQLHRDTISGFEPDIFNLIAEPDTSIYGDTDIQPGCSYYYRVSAVDNQDNMSAYSDELEVTFTGIGDESGAELPRITAISNNYPNPFNSNTTIVYSVANLGPIPAEIKIEIYDISGRKVRVLVNDRKGVGLHRVIWDGRDDYGGDCASGVYFARISQWGLSFGSKPRKLVLIR